MTRKHFVLSILLLALMLFLFSACSPAADMTPTPDTSIVWADDFEDGDTEGWIVFDEGTLSFVEGVFAFTLGTYNADGIIYHESDVSTGTWSFDLFYPEDATPDYEIVLSCDQDWQFGLSVYLMTVKNTMASIRTYSDGVRQTGESASLGQKLSGWNHFDITRDDSGNTKLYLNGELILENKDELTYSPQYFGIVTFASGPVLDNLVIRNQVVDIQPAEME